MSNNAATGIDATPNTNIHTQNPDEKLAHLSGSDDMALSSSPPSKDRRESREWDAAKVPPSQFQRRKGSIYATPSSRDGHVKGSDRDKAYHDKLKEKGWSK
ncbi:hypothetical protein BU24DRAFT_419558 [Aaosphaeria arxii CBS 175.79]|uniref:Uncharacterized protein n=1 Tax=Aaosphaeria arxii CBS 175.79 TaxID=1450172 RepID=A0A6A5Y325_9PLEO|nr:uncharacterized protein BU24DRAFT_419558 [Aaosphaeria arxii CBS 175.79]KAF2019952.1 hypothetical protein BU24DRAFT_419558 [Aaosphaeria arxii CBS 175.79]